ncbi:phosphate starvation-inducible protein PhoH [Lachnospiraceae bacterium]|nr:phosphate starvation-inducible protein PhoH [Lachnospiraceae bacterium]
MSIKQSIIRIDERNIQFVFGQFDKNIRKIEKAFGITYVCRGDSLIIEGMGANVDMAERVINDLLVICRNGGEITDQAVDYSIKLATDGDKSNVSELEDDKEIICHTLSGRPIRPKTFGQKEYVNAIDNNMIIFGCGPAGTGKTYLAMAKAITAFKKGEVERIILTRPAIEAGEKLGFLPGDLQSKIDPYLRPLYDALYEILGAESFQKNMEKGLIEVAPLAYMRGRTLDNAFIVLDEAQNTTQSQMKMFLTRIGFGSKAIITGDQSQKDLAAGTVSGLDTALRIVKNIEGIAVCNLTSKDVVRHPLVQKIVEAYEEYDRKNSYKKDSNIKKKNFTSERR